MGISPVYLIPPSAIIGILVPLIAFFTSRIAESWGYPTPAITLVVQIEPGPIPTFNASAPILTRYLAASNVAIFPTTKSKFENLDFTFLTTSPTPLLCPWAVSITIASTPAV